MDYGVCTCILTFLYWGKRAIATGNATAKQSVATEAFNGILTHEYLDQNEVLKTKREKCLKLMLRSTNNNDWIFTYFSMTDMTSGGRTRIGAGKNILVNAVSNTACKNNY